MRSLFVNLYQFLILADKSAAELSKILSLIGCSSYGDNALQKIVRGDSSIKNLNKHLIKSINIYNKNPELNIFDWKMYWITQENLQRIYRLVMEKPASNKKSMGLFLELMIKVTERESNKDEGIDKRILDQEQYQDDCKLENYLKSVQNTASSSKLSVHREIAYSWFNTQKKGTGRYKGYFETRRGNPIHHLRNRLSINESGEYSLLDILFPESKGSNGSVNLVGRAGGGKSYQILHCIDDIFNEKTTDYGDSTGETDISNIVKDVVPIYVPLNSVEDCNGNCIISFLAIYVWKNEASVVTNVLSELKNKVLIFADGFNEITDPNMRRKIARDINNIRENYGTRFLVSSRIDHSNIFNSLNGSDHIFKKANVLALSPEQIDKYFSDVGCVARYKNIPVSTRKLLETPQGCVMYADYVSGNVTLVRQIKSLAQLLDDYANRILNICNSWEKLEIEDILKKIAYYMVLHDTFRIKSDEIKKLINDSEMIRKLFDNQSNIESVFSSNDGNDLFEFSHQNFRDNYCAKAFSSKINSISADNIIERLNDGKIFVINSITTNDEILELVSSFVEDDTIQYIINWIRQNQEYICNYNFPLSILIKIYSFSHKNCIADLDLSGLDLTNISLNGYELFDRENDRCINLSGSKISENTFLKAALQTASSAICKYEMNNKTYVVAFARKTAVIIDVNENRVETIRNMPDYGWINSAVPKMYDDRIRIFLGCENGSVATFSPDNNLHGIKRIFIETKEIKTSVKGHGDIENILFPVWNGVEYIVFCNSTGDIFYRELDTINGLGYKTISLYDSEEELKEIRAKFYKNNWDVSCRLSIRDNVVIAAFGDKVYRLNFNEENKQLLKSEIKIGWKHEEPFLILDICFTENYIFINKGNSISVIYFSTNRNLSRKEICIFEISNTHDDPITRHYSSRRSDVGEDFYFYHFSKIPPDMYTGHDSIEGVLVGIVAYHSASYGQLPNFFELGMSGKGTRIESLSVTEIRNEQGLATHTGAYYLSLNDNMVHLATTCDDRSIDLQIPHHEEMAIVHIKGAYNGVHDIQILDSKNVICALYDGNVIHISCNANQQVCDWTVEFEDYPIEETWSVKNVKAVHMGWVWKILAGKWNDEFNNVVTCSYDKTVMVTNLKSKDPPQEIIHGSKPILDFYISSRDNSIWAISESYIYHSHFENGKWECDEPVSTPHEGAYFRAIVENVGVDRANNVPLFFYNFGEGSEGYIGKIQDGKSTEFCRLGENVFIRKMINYSVGETKYMIAAGGLNKQSYVAIYRVDSHEKYALVSETEIDGTTGANSFVFAELRDKKIIIVLSKNNLVSLIRLNDDMKIDRNIVSEQVPAQPMCIDAYIEDDFNLILIGLLNGQMMELKISDDDKIDISNFVETQSNLIAKSNINLKECKFEDKDSFTQQLKDYFTI